MSPPVALNQPLLLPVRRLVPSGLRQPDALQIDQGMHQLHEAGRSDSGGVARHGIRGALVVAQVAISAGLFVRSFERAEHMYLGFDPNNVLTVNLDPHQIGYDEARTKAFYRELEDRVRARPGVMSASLSFNVPMGYPSKAGSIYMEGIFRGATSSLLRFRITASIRPTLKRCAFPCSRAARLRIPITKRRRRWPL